MNSALNWHLREGTEGHFKLKKIMTIRNYFPYKFSIAPGKLLILSVTISELWKIVENCQQLSSPSVRAGT